MRKTTSISSYPQSPAYEPLRGAHVFVERGAYSHHGIDCGDGTVIDFAGLGAGKTMPVIRRVTLGDFAQGATVRRRAYGYRASADEVVARAESMIGRSGYDLFSNNCEHFATWCAAGTWSSEQVDGAWAAASIVAVGRLVPPVGARAIVGFGETAPRSASNVMSGLKRVGGSPVGGVAVVGGVGAATGVAAMLVALRDKPHLAEDERAARSAGRVAAFAGGALATGGVVHAVGALGSPGFGAAGVSSGLASLGAAGGGMLAGVAIAAGIPLLAAVVLGLLVLCFRRCWTPESR